MNAALHRISCSLVGGSCLALSSLSTVAAFPHSGLVQLSAGLDNSCVVMADHQVSCWGDALVSSGPTPLPVPGIHSAVAVASGFNFACAILVDQTVSCWGSNVHGQLGDGTRTSRTTPATVISRSHGQPLENVIAIAAGEEHVCALRSDTSIWCWGSNSDGQIGNVVVAVGDDALHPLDVASYDPAAGVSTELTNFQGLTTGPAHSCATFGTGDYTMACWGQKSYGRLGDGETVTTTSTPLQSPVAVKAFDGSNLVGTAEGIISAGNDHTCAILPADAPHQNSIGCWGDNFNGELGNSAAFGDATSYAEPVVFSGGNPLNDVSSLTSGDAFSCTLLISDHSVACWGVDNLGQLGNSDETSGDSVSPLPVQAHGITLVGFDEIAARGDHACARHGASVLCWGGNGFGQLGIGSSDMTAHPSPQNALVDAPIFADNLDGN